MEIIITILNLLFTSGLGAFLFYSSSKRKHAAEAGTAEQSTESVAIANMRESAVEWKEIAESREEKLNKKDVLIDKLYAEKSEDRNVVHRLTSEVNKLMLENQSLTFRLCNKRRCTEREPKSEY